MNQYSSNNSIVDEMIGFEFAGNLVPHSWYKTILKENGKPDLVAITILSDVVYWYRPTEVRDEMTGQLIGYKKKFKADLLQRNYEQIGELFGITKSTAKRAVINLERIGVIERVLRDYWVGAMKLNNVLFIKLNPKRLKELTDVIHNEEVCANLDTPSINNEQRCITKTNTSPFSNERTNTKNTTENIITEYLNLSYQERLDSFKKQIGYDALVIDMKYQKKELDNLVGIAMDILTTSKKSIRVNGEEKPTQVVKSQFCKLNMGHIRYVLDCVGQATVSIGNIRAFIITSLYNAVSTMDLYYTQRVQRDMYESA